jgi:hypothetical protein
MHFSYCNCGACVDYRTKLSGLAYAGAQQANLPKDILAEREVTHGDYAKSAALAQDMKRAFRSMLGMGCLPAVQQEAAEMILFKLARIACGKSNHPDHWADIAGYAQLVLKELQK